MWHIHSVPRVQEILQLHSEAYQGHQGRRGTWVQGLAALAARAAGLKLPLPPPFGGRASGHERHPVLQLPSTITQMLLILSCCQEALKLHTNPTNGATAGTTPHDMLDKPADLIEAPAAAVAAVLLRVRCRSQVQLPTQGGLTGPDPLAAQVQLHRCWQQAVLGCFAMLPAAVLQQRRQWRRRLPGRRCRLPAPSL